MNFPEDELAKMVYVIGESHGSCVLAARIYNQRYPERRQPQIKAFKRVKARFEENSTVRYSKPVKPNHILTTEMQIDILLEATENPQIGQRKLSRQLDISKTSVQKCLRANKYHAYHFQKVQRLRDEDFPRRVEFCQWALNKINEDRFFLHKVLFMDESTFHKNGQPNSRNHHHYADVNPHLIRQTHFQDRWSINVWGGILGLYVIGPFFFLKAL